MKYKPNSIEDAAKVVAFNFQLKSIEEEKGPLEAFKSINVELPFEFPDDWRACDFASLVTCICKREDENG